MCTTLDELSKLALELYLELASEIKMELWTILDASASLKEDGEGRKANERHAIKLKKLKEIKNHATNKDDAITHIDNKVINLSS